MAEKETQTPQKRKIWKMVLLALPLLFLAAGTAWYAQRWIPPEEAALRQKVMDTAEAYLGCKEADGTHQPIIDLYNSHEPRARDYEVTYEDSWCAAFGSAVAIQCGLTEIIPAECGCQQQIALFDSLGRWEESDWYLPQPGDYIFYDWEGPFFGSNTGWSDHVGIVAAVYGPVIKVIEGNKDDSVAYRWMFVGSPSIRGYGLPDYGKMA